MIHKASTTSSTKWSACAGLEKAYTKKIPITRRRLLLFIVSMPARLSSIQLARWTIQCDKERTSAKKLGWTSGSEAITRIVLMGIFTWPNFAIKYIPFSIIPTGSISNYISEIWDDSLQIVCSQSILSEWSEHLSTIWPDTWAQPRPSSEQHGGISCIRNQLWPPSKLVAKVLLIRVPKRQFNEWVEYLPSFSAWCWRPLLLNRLSSRKEQKNPNNNQHFQKQC